MAKMPVWKATSSMALAIWVIRWALSLMPSMARERASIRVLASWMHWAISAVFVRVWPLLSLTLDRRSFTRDTSSTSSSVDWVCSREAWCSWVDWPLSSSLISARRPAAFRKPRMVSFMDWRMAPRLERIRVKSPL